MKSHKIVQILYFPTKRVWYTYSKLVKIRTKDEESFLISNIRGNNKAFLFL